MDKIEKIIKDYHRIVTDPAKTSVEKALVSIRKSTELARAIQNSFGYVTQIDLPIIYAAARLVAEVSIEAADDEQKRILEISAELAIATTERVSVVLKGDR